MKFRFQMKDPETFINSNLDLSDPEDFEGNVSLLETILAAGKNASSKRSSSRR